MPTPTLPLRASLEAKLKLRASETNYRHHTMLPWVREFNRCAGLQAPNPRVTSREAGIVSIVLCTIWAIVRPLFHNTSVNHQGYCWYCMCAPPFFGPRVGEFSLGKSQHDHNGRNGSTF
ncbi:hypothetical protein B0H13DRAFT_2672644 [Mycena leptocephala]|nr:hypothetical protein B0H13DRAFT_2672644 [Mycena leptocephala]